MTRNLRFIVLIREDTEPINEKNGSEKEARVTSEHENRVNIDFASLEDCLHVMFRLVSSQFLEQGGNHPGTKTCKQQQRDDRSHLILETKHKSLVHSGDVANPHNSLRSHPSAELQSLVSIQSQRITNDLQN